MGEQEAVNRVWPELQVRATPSLDAFVCCVFFSRDKNKSTAVWMEQHSDIIIYRDMSGLIVPFFTGTFVSIGAGLLQHPQLFQNSRLLAVSE